MEGFDQESTLCSKDQSYRDYSQPQVVCAYANFEASADYEYRACC